MKGALGNLMRQAQEMQSKMQQKQQELAEKETEGQSGAGMIKVVMNGRHEVKRVTIDPSVLEEDKEFLEDLVAAAVNDAVARVEEQNKEVMSDLTSGLNLPPGMNLPF
ncbi:YbaB/EbfC family nucleoid-associated protein [Abyssibacter sp.]|jgi:hypothetical protein|uniref:YbaB/EbfC family nucleoid-associated protein n=1 Tax=Abyssibacter sp. TaxID=2320200 RepID=UPI0035157DC5